MTGPADTHDASGAGRLVVRGGALRVVGYGFGAALSVLGAALVTRHLGASDYGRFQTVVALATIVAALSDLGISTLGLREYSHRSGTDREDFLRMLLTLRVLLSLVAIPATVLAAVALGYDATMVGGAALQGAGVLLAGVATTLTVPLSAELRLGTLAVLDVLRQGVTTGSYALLVVAGAGLGTFFGVAPVAAVAVLAATIALVAGRYPLRPRLAAGMWRGVVRPALTFGVATASGQAYIYTALVLCGLVTTAHETGLFAASFRVYLVVAVVPGILVTGAFPVLARAARERDGDPDGGPATRLGAMVAPLAGTTAALGGAAALTCALGAPAIIAVVAGDGFDGAIGVLRVQGLALGLTFVIAALGFTLLADHRHRAIALSNLLALVVSAVTVLVLAHHHGARGAAWATVLGEAVLAGAYLVALRRAIPGLAVGLGRLLRVLAGAGLGAAAGALPGLPSVPATAIGLAVYGAVLLASGALPPEVRAHLPGLGRSAT
ncbi:MAG TPA: lipopolysaccharide biosynthesis protein [Baekduia sp.]|uniref:lipopolysaccharide biosynthesis protein n=1 Tax=Baekduia sp. TaxID=2600305 RepID=UPI002D7A169B|nr:lipopolysaccharide biosynthesis protein [Baekduia sp.]HET6509472.1 lipopolysaccharide biosynthesis protein [Baekduia sp.]